MPMFCTASLPNFLSFHNLWRQLYLYAYVNIVKIYLTVICFNLLPALGDMLLYLSVSRSGAWWRKVLVIGGNGDHGSRNRGFDFWSSLIQEFPRWCRNNSKLDQRIWWTLTLYHNTVKAKQLIFLIVYKCDHWNIPQKLRLFLWLWCPCPHV